MKNTISALILALSMFLSGAFFNAHGEDTGRTWHYFAGFNTTVVPAFHTDDSRIAVQVPIGAICGAVKDYGIYMRMAMTGSVNAEYRVDHLADLGDDIANPILPDGRVDLNSTYYQLAIGPVFRVKNEFYLYGGLAWYSVRGFAKRTDGEYVRINDRSTHTLGIDAGAMYRYRHIFMSAGASLDCADWFDNSSYNPFVTANLTVGYFF